MPGNSFNEPGMLEIKGGCGSASHCLLLKARGVPFEEGTALCVF